MTVPEVKPASTHWPANSLPPDLLAAKTLIYDVAAMACSDPVPEVEGAGYGAHEFTVADRAIRFRVAKTTPKKPGQFVTLWTRTAHGPIAPFDVTDDVDLYVISTRDVGGFGQFVFPRTVLGAHGVLSTKSVGGKRGFRVYPPWMSVHSRQATLTQAWQVEYFLEVPADGAVNTATARNLYGR